MIYINKKDNCVSINDEIQIEDIGDGFPISIKYRISFDLVNKRVILRNASYSINYTKELERQTGDFELTKAREFNTALFIKERENII